MSEYPNLTIAARLRKHPPVLPWLITDVVVVVFTPAITIHVRFACAGAVQPEPGSLVPAAQLRPMFAARVRSGTASLAQLPLTGRILPGVGADTLELVVIAAVIDVAILDDGRLRTGFFVLLRPLLLLLHCLRIVNLGKVDVQCVLVVVLPLDGRDRSAPVVPVQGSLGRRHAPAAMRQFLLRHGDAPSRQQHAPADLSRLTSARQ
uniref:Uncharacterized protein n=1 Tax=Anopheles melas TaxID=34690 RepID=A0A182TZW1_9DIPT